MTDKKINLVAVDMGYGHQRAAYPLQDLSGGEMITLNNYPGIPLSEVGYWRNHLQTYERISRLKKIPFLGPLIFGLMDSFQEIEPLYPRRDLSRPTQQQKYFYRAVRRGLGRDLVNKLGENGLPFVTTFFVAAYAAEQHGYRGDIYCIICDADASRAWAPLEPAQSRIKYLLPNENVRQRFLMYGVRPENLLVTGFPLPKENVGADQEVARKDLARRVAALDPDGIYRHKYMSLLRDLLPEMPASGSGVTITFAVGGAGAQKEIGAELMERMAPEIKAGRIRLNLVAGNRQEVKDYFAAATSRIGLGESGVKIIYNPDKTEYFRAFNDCLHETDILWTKPSELSFYSALGLPLVMTATVGSQEDFNREWLLLSGAGIDSLDHRYVDQWLPALIKSGRLARAAVDGYLNAEKMATYKIEHIIKGEF